ncbi:MAG TPA: hypothetical protein VIV60_16770 [Polyangiaceae bacterium]
MPLPKKRLSVIGVLVLGCHTASESGELFDVKSTFVSSSCGAAVDIDDGETFQVRLTYADDSLTWYELDTGETTQGSISDNAFTLAEVTGYQMTAATGYDPGCAVRRHDAYSGTFTKTAERVSRFAATVVSNYSEASGYTCDSLIGVSGGFTDLPCTVNYTLVGTAAD